jgi:phosphoribosylaminoimidazolecarboxamide formyltransferase/IMP cyclohydrolase
MMQKRTALLSVSNRTGLEVLAKGLSEMGFTLLTTSGTAKYLATHGVSSQSIEDYTGQAEIFGGRVKTLHPKLYAGILARREVPEDMQALQHEGILPIDVVAVNLYPFREALAGDKALSTRETTDKEMIELIDIGGPSMIRAAAKNHEAVLPLIDPSDYADGLRLLAGELSEQEERALRRQLAAKVFATLADDGVAVAAYLTGEHTLTSERQRQCGLPQDGMEPPPLLGRSPDRYSGMVVNRQRALRYGENPHQSAAWYAGLEVGAGAWKVHGGKTLSYNNLLDVDAIIRMLDACGNEHPCAIIVKHTNPCGAARGRSLGEALHKAKRGDPRSHFGGIIGFNGAVDVEAAAAIREDFAEVVVAPRYEPEALSLLMQNKNLRVLEANPRVFRERREVRSVLDGYLVQSRDVELSDSSSWRQVSGAGHVVTAAQMRDLLFAWTFCAHVKSNAIVVVKNEMLCGVGAGQMSRIDSVEVALMKARLHEHDLTGGVAASDAFFPFPDALESLANAGITAVIAPSGAKRDPEIIAAADAAGVALFHTSDRHFRH